MITCMNGTRVGYNRYRVGDDLLVVYRHDKKTVTIFDANSPAWSRKPPQSLQKIQREAVLKFNKTNERIRCSDCGKRNPPQSLDWNGRCNVCSEKFEIEHPFKHTPDPDWMKREYSRVCWGLQEV